MLQAQRLLETSDYSVDEVAGRCGFRSPVALRGHFRRQLGSSPAAYRAAYRARRPQGDRPGETEPAVPQPGQQGAPAGLSGPVGGPPPALAYEHRDGGVPMQTRRAAAGAVGLLPGPRSGS